ncbi:MULTISPECIES: sensor domain-containing diguanylate cyclase [Clostridium]|uniref:sensor domain-containing diguanylate cyclase n=1 Tax=Clostridium TaxID=1485 RepID=UPI000826B473|nr:MULTISPECIES: diguanylate cyclase [Clostridium]PJI08601.1 diguanylate cyclase [Clostridium sp. CT7]
MKQYGFVYDNFEQMQSFIYSNNIHENDNILIQVFTGVINVKFIENIISEIISILPQAEIIGTTTGGEIKGKEILTNNVVISVTIFDKVKIKSKLLNSNDNEYELGVIIAKELIEDDTKVIILFSEGVATNSFDILKGIQSINSSIPISGGKAGDNGHLKNTFVFTKEGISKNGAAAVSLTGRQLNVITEYSFGWSTIGKLMTVTKAENDRVYTIDNIKTADIYRKYLGDEVAKELPTSAYEFPLIVIKDGIKIAKVPYACNDDGSLSFLSNIEVNDKVKFGFGNVNMLIDRSLEICDRLAKRNIEALFVYSCFIRKSFMREKINLDIAPLNSIAPTLGFFTNGEFFTINNSSRVLNVSMTILGVSEGKQDCRSNGNLGAQNESQVKSSFEKEEFRTIKAFTKLVGESTKELEEANEVLRKQNCNIQKMNSITKSIFEINSEMISTCKFDNFMELMLDKILDIIKKGKIGSILLVENNRLYYKATRGYITSKIKDVTYNIKEVYDFKKIANNNLFNPIIIKSTKKPVFFNDGKFNLWRDILDEEPKEILTCCIGIDGEVAGLINIFNTDSKDDFDEEDKNIFKYICYDIAIALKNIRLLEDVLHMSRYDYLTGVYNRGYFTERFNEILDKSKNLKTTFIVCGIDLNDFKIINDTYGHEKGDEVLIKFAEIFKNEMDKDDILGRSGGDEFTVVFVNKSKKQVVETINRISNVLKNCDFGFDSDVDEISFSYGLSEFLSDSDDVRELLKMADRKMYKKKSIMKK